MDWAGEKVGLRGIFLHSSWEGLAWGRDGVQEFEGEENEAEGLVLHR